VASLFDKYKITHRFLPYYLQGKGQAEICNRTILGNLCKILGRAKCKWAEKLLGVLWAYRTTKQVLTEETPFSLAYGTKSIIPIDISTLTDRPREARTQLEGPL